MRIMTYNIRGGLGMDGRRSTARIAETVAGQAPDIVCFQEIHQRMPQSRLIDQPRRLQKLLGMPFTFQANLHMGLGRYGVGVATRYPVLSVRNHLLPSVGEQRGALEMRVQTPAGDRTLFCTHWGLHTEERRKQAAQMAEWILAAPGPRIVCGDFNDGPESESIRALLARTGLIDADAVENRLTYPADQPEERIDYIFYSPELSLKKRECVATQASDHLPLVADLA